MRGTYRVNEIFRSIQGEGHWSGRTAIFVRFAGCNLKCSFCDTDHKDGVAMEGPSLVQRAQEQARSGDMLVLTGGEPLLQVDGELLGRLFDYFNLIAIETNGTIEVPTVPRVASPPARLWATVSPKDPKTWRDLPALFDADELKVVVPGNGWTRDDLAELARAVTTRRLYLQPEDGARLEESKQWMVQTVMANSMWRASVQMHKVLALR